MPIFTNDPPSDPRGPSLTLLRCPVSRHLVAVITSLDLVGCKTHYYQGKTQPCEEPKCPACLDGLPWRWHSYVSAWDWVNKRHFLFESTARATEPFIQYRASNFTLRGCLFTAKRIKCSANSQVYIQTKPADLEKMYLPEPPNLVKLLTMIWHLPDGIVQTNSTMKDVDELAIDTKRLNEIRRRQNDLLPDRENSPPKTLPLPRMEHTG